jgi:hypothetical protein
VRNPNFHLWDPTPITGRTDVRWPEYIEQRNRAAAVELNRCRWRYPDGHVCDQQKGADDHVLSVIPDAAVDPEEKP